MKQMGRIERELIEYGITNKEQMIKYFLFKYEYSFQKYVDKDKKIDKTFMESLENGIKDIKDVSLEKLWYILNYKYLLMMLENDKFLSQIILEAIEEVPCSNIDIIEKHYQSIYSIIRIGNMDCLLERAIWELDNNGTDEIFLILKSKKKEFLDLLNKYESYINIDFIINKNDCICHSYVTDFITYNGKILEIWALKTYSFIIEKVLNNGELNISKYLSKSKDDIYKEIKKEYCIDLLEAYNSFITKIFKTKEMDKVQLSDIYNTIEEINLSVINKLVHNEMKIIKI